MATRDEIKKVIAYMALAFQTFHPDVTINPNAPNTIDVYEDLLGDLPFDVLWLAAKAACVPGTSKQFAPSPDEIRMKVSSLKSKADGVPSAGEAWGEIIGSFERMPGGNMAGGGHTPILDHPLVQKAVHCMGGYTAIGADYFENQMPNRAHFLKIYADLMSTWKDEAAELPQITAYVQAQKQIESATKLLTDKLEVS